jgi:WD40 repeat protein
MSNDAFLLICVGSRYFHDYNEIMGGQVHSRAVRDISFSPTDVKFVTCSDDSSLKVFDFDRVIVLLIMIIINITCIIIIILIIIIIIIVVVVIIIIIVLSLLELGRHQHR